MIIVTLLLGLVNRQQRKLRGSEERYRALFEHAGDGIGVVTALDHRLVDANKKFEDILGYLRKLLPKIEPFSTPKPEEYCSAYLS